MQLMESNHWRISAMSSSTLTKQILVVEDNFADAQLIREVFGDLPQVQWHFVENLVHARDFLRHLPPYHLSPRPDLILLDLKLPIFPGYTLIPQIKSDPALRDIKVIVFTTSQADKDRAMCEKFGADGYVIKPMALRDWSAALKSAIMS
jgi:chemotaxis family two-component system response regulator Rcp1